MRKALLFAALAALALASCDKEPEDVLYERNFAVKNATGKTIEVDGDRALGMYLASPVVIAPGKTEFVITGSFPGLNESSGKQQEYLKADDIIPFDAATTAGLLPEGETWYDMTVGGMEAPKAIWRRKYWDFLSDGYNTLYTLTVTDALLAELAAVEE